MNLDETTNKHRMFVWIALAATVLGLTLAACGRTETVQAVPAGARPGDSHPRALPVQDGRR